MARFLYLNSVRKLRKSSRWILAFCWIIGLIFGTLCYLTAGNLPFPMMRGAVSCSVSIAGLLVSAFFPLLLSAFAVYISARWLFFPIAFTKAFVFAWISACCTSAFGASGWLIRLLFLFSDNLSTVVLYLFWMYHLSDDSRLFCRTTWVMVLLVAVIAGVDFSMIAPFLRGLLIL